MFSLVPILESHITLMELAYLTWFVGVRDKSLSLELLS